MDEWKKIARMDPVIQWEPADAANCGMPPNDQLAREAAERNVGHNYREHAELMRIMANNLGLPAHVLKEPNMDDRVAVCYIDQSDLLAVLRWPSQGPGSFLRVRHVDVPRTAEVLSVWVSHERRAIGIMLRDESFAPVPLGMEPPVLQGVGMIGVVDRRWPVGNHLEAERASYDAYRKRKIRDVRFIVVDPVKAGPPPADLGDDPQHVRDAAAELADETESSSDFFRRVMGTP